jgi:hypothetical protein
VAGSGIVEARESVGATVHLVGSVRTGLVMNNRDVDFHIHTDEPAMPKSRAAMERLKRNTRIHGVTCLDLLDTGDECLQWQALYDYRTGIDRGMLYIAVTRALHRLTLTCSGPRSTLL